MRIESSIVIRRPPAAVFRFVADLSNEFLFGDGLAAEDALKTVASGEVFKTISEVKDGRDRSIRKIHTHEIKEFVPDSRVAVEKTDPDFGKSLTSYSVRAAGEGTQLTVSVDGESDTGGGALDGVASLLMRKGLEARLRKIKELEEDLSGEVSPILISRLARVPRRLPASLIFRQLFGAKGSLGGWICLAIAGAILRYAGAFDFPLFGHAIQVALLPAVVFALLGLMGVVWGLKNGFKTIRLLARGLIAEAKFVSRGLGKGSSFGRKRWELTFSFVNASGAERQATVPCDRPALLQDGRRNYLLYDPADQAAALSLNMMLTDVFRLGDSGGIESL